MDADGDNKDVLADFGSNDDNVDFCCACKSSVVGKPTKYKTSCFANCNMKKKGIPKSWILLDSQLTCDIFSNKELLTDIHKVEGTTTLTTQAGTTSTNMAGFLPNYGMVWYHPKGIANILSLANIIEQHRVIFDSAVRNRFVVHKVTGKEMYVQAKRGLYFYNIKNSNFNIPSSKDLIAYSHLIETVADNLKQYSKRD